MFAVNVNDKTFYAGDLKYARRIGDKWVKSSKDSAEAILIGGQLCNFKGKNPVAGLPYALISAVDSGEVTAELLNRLKAAVEKIEAAQEALCDLSLDIEDTMEALCDLSLEVDNHG